ERSQHGCSELGGPSCYLAEGLLDAFTEVSLTDRNGPFEPRVSRVAGLEVIRQRSRGNRVDLFLHLGTRSRCAGAPLTQRFGLASVDDGEGVAHMGTEPRHHRLQRSEERRGGKA